MVFMSISVLLGRNCPVTEPSAKGGSPEAPQRSAAVRAGAATPASRGTSAASEQRSALTAKSAVVRSAGTGQARSPLPVSVSGTRADRGQTPRSGSAAEPPQTDVLAVEEDFETNWGIVGQGVGCDHRCNGFLGGRFFHVTRQIFCGHGIPLLKLPKRWPRVPLSFRAGQHSPLPLRRIKIDLLILEVANQLKRSRSALLRNHDDALEKGYGFKPRKRRTIARVLNVTRYLTSLQHGDHGH